MFAQPGVLEWRLIAPTTRIVPSTHLRVPAFVSVLVFWPRLWFRGKGLEGCLLVALLAQVVRRWPVTIDRGNRGLWLSRATLNFAHHY